MAERDTSEAPSLELIVDLKKHNEHVWRPQMDKDEKVLEMLADEHAVEVPDTRDPERNFISEPEIQRSGMLATVWNRVRPFYPNPADLGVMQEAGGAFASLAPDQAEEWLVEWFDQAMEDAGENVWDLGNGDGLSLGRRADLVLAAQAYYWDWPKDLPDDIEKRHKVLTDWLGKAPMPVIWRHIPASTVFPPSLGRINDEALSVQKVLASDIIEHFRETEAAEMLKDMIRGNRLERYESIDMALYANRRWVTWAVLGEKLPNIPGRKGQGGLVAAEYRHGMGVNPIQITAAFTSNRKEPGYYWTCPVMEVMEQVKALDRRLSEWATHSRLAGMGPWVFTMFDDDLGQDGLRGGMEQRKQGDAIVAKMDRETGRAESVSTVAPPQQTQMIGELVQLTIGFIERKTGVSPVLSGAGLERSSGAAHVKIVADLATEIYAPASVNFGRHSKSIGERCFAAIAAFKEDAPLTKRGDKPGEGVRLTLSPSQAEAFKLVVTAEMEPRFKVTETSDIGLYLRGVELDGAGNPAWPKRYGIERFLREQNVSSFRDEMFIDEYEKLPEIRAQIANWALIRARAKVNQQMAISQAELLRLRAEGLFDTVEGQGFERDLVQRGVMPPRGPEFPTDATPQSLAQTGRIPATVQSPRPEAEL